ncbi:MAG TPA: hypothetical protein IAC12_08100 [Candidatus Aphodovivens avistercoris]|nr:hypothetical protein [Candidatus Aphodovivens avistercoris]
MKEELTTMPLIVHDAACSRYCKIIKMLVVFAAAEAFAIAGIAAVVTLF